MDRRISDTDVIYDLMIHDIDILLNAIVPNAKPASVKALGRKVYSERYMDYVESFMSFDNDVIASVVSSRTTESKIRKIQVHCENAYVDADLLNRTLTISRKTAYKLNVGYDPVYKQENVIERIIVPNEEPLKAELKYFYNSIVSRKIPEINNGRTALNSIQLLDQIKREIY